MVEISSERVKGDFVREIERIAGDEILKCYQCGNCSAGCPMVDVMDITPNQIMRYIQLGMDEVLNCNAIWVCISCLMCEQRCPRKVKIPAFIEALKVMQIRRGEDHVNAMQIPKEFVGEIPILGMVSGMRKYAF